MADTAIDSNAITSHEQDGRVLSGVGVSADRLAETMDRHAPPEPVAPAPEAAPPAAPESTTATPEAPVSRGRQRFSDLTRERDEAKAAADALKAEREALARERDELRQRLDQGARAAEPAAPVEPPAQPDPTRPEPTEDEIGTKYKTYAEFTRDLARWVVEQERAAQAQSYEDQVREVLARERSRDQFQSAIQTSQERGRKAYPDFDALLNGPTGKIVLATDQQEAIARVAFIANHPQSEHIQYAILKDAALAERLRESDPYTFGVTVAGLVPPATPAPAARTWTPPPPPHPIVGASSPTVSKSSAELTKGGYDFDKSGYREKRAAERGIKTRRW